MEKTIILVGLGKAGKLHYNSYKKIGIETIYLVDKNPNPNYFKNYKIYQNLESVINEVDCKGDNIIVDITTPYENFYEIITNCKKLGLKNIIVEKPFVLQNDYDFRDLNIIMTQNYLYSKVYKYIKNYIFREKLQISYMFSNFSKDRREDTFNLRGIGKTLTDAFHIEIPHQVYLTIDLFNDDIKLIYKNSEDFCFKNKIFKNLGEANLFLKTKSTFISLYSNLATDILNKKIEILTKENIYIVAKFFTYNSDMQIIDKGNVNIYKDKKLIKSVSFKQDDMMCEMIKSYCNDFNLEFKLKYHRKKIEKFSTFYNNYIN